MMKMMMMEGKEREKYASLLIIGHTTKLHKGIIIYGQSDPYFTIFSHRIHHSVCALPFAFKG